MCNIDVWNELYHLFSVLHFVPGHSSDTWLHTNTSVICPAQRMINFDKKLHCRSLSTRLGLEKGIDCVLTFHWWLINPRSSNLWISFQLYQSVTYWGSLLYAPDIQYAHNTSLWEQNFFLLRDFFPWPQKIFLCTRNTFWWALETFSFLSFLYYFFTCALFYFPVKHIEALSCMKCTKQTKLTCLLPQPLQKPVSLLQRVFIWNFTFAVGTLVTVPDEAEFCCLQTSQVHQMGLLSYGENVWKWSIKWYNALGFKL